MTDSELIKTKLDVIESYARLGAKTVLTLEETSIFTGLSKTYLYKLTCNHMIPHYKPNGRNLYFDKSELENWMRQNKVNVNEE